MSCPKCIFIGRSIQHKVVVFLKDRIELTIFTSEALPFLENLVQLKRSLLLSMSWLVLYCKLYCRISNLSLELNLMHSALVLSWLDSTAQELSWLTL